MSTQLCVYLHQCVHACLDGGPPLEKHRLNVRGEGLLAADLGSAPLRSNYLQQHQDQDLQTVHLPPCFIPPEAARVMEGERQGGGGV